METYYSHWITEKASPLLGILCIFHSLGAIANVNFECWLKYCKKHQFKWICALSGFTKKSHKSTLQMILLLYMSHQVEILYFTLLQISGASGIIMFIIHFDMVLIHLHVYIANYLRSTHSCFPAMEQYSLILSNCMS